MPGDIKHHTDKFRSCVEKVVKSGKSEDSAYAICTTSLQDAGEAIFEVAESFEALSNPEGINQYTAGGSARFTGKSADGKFEGSADVRIVNPHSNAHKVTQTKGTGKRTRMYEGAFTHLPTATVELDRSKRGLEPLRFEAHHHSLKSLGADMYSLHLLGATGQVRTEMLDGKEYLVVPIVALMEGVIHAVNSETPEFVPLATLQKAAATWNGRPVVLGHPVKDGTQCSANSPEILMSHGIGTIYNSRIEGTKLLQEAWVEKSKAKKLNPEMYDRLLNSTPEEVSVGAYVVTDRVAGEYNGKKFLGNWLETVGDHLAFLPGGRGACSLEMGCGTHRAAMRVCADTMELETAAGARHSSADMKAIQGVHDHSVSLGAKCDSYNTKFMSYASRTLDGASLDERMQAISRAVDKEFGSPIMNNTGQYAYPQTVYDDHVIIRKMDKLFSVDYTFKNGVVTFTSDPVEMVQEYVEASAYKDCPTCDGTGQVKGKDGKQEDCPTCDGEGKLKTAMKHACGCHEAKTVQTIRNEGGRWAVYSSDGSRRLSSHTTEADAQAHEKAIEAAKKRRSLELQRA